MRIQVDTHTHTYASGHAYSTIIENAFAASQLGLPMFCTTDHTSSMPGAPHYWFFNNQRVLPRFIHNVAIVRGCEANICNDGEIDIPPSVDSHLDWVIASFHEPVFPSKDSLVHTQALIKVIRSNRVDALGHLGNPNFDFDFEAVIACAAEYNVAIELNNTSLKGETRIGSIDRCYEIAKVAKKLGAYVTTGSDAHFCEDIGKFSKVEQLIDDIDFPLDKVITHTPKQFLDFLALRGRAPIEEFKKLMV
ncbi:phosphatase [Aliivibrio fischeri]|uniref:phosphatase n=1 Tax=Aliivibrio fischeri TaxID=668 RepID=UPI00080DA013|nr:phosphatase [Aliivibrio fischeri]MCE4935265.1 phosphatase [Aliivibrio fischeri]MUH95932.1 phosphatase [Aliivibrio fischeri]MUI62789.1 phosphatase [Aliivibrio fischeri]OCH06001.1 phosphatase [Aliivibrio fischeri]OCH62424.1 phosphatase [Aliivibrio fischeri]